MIKKSILSAHKQDAEYYLKCFRSMRRSGTATYKNYLTNLKEMANRYIEAKGIDTLDKVIHAFVLEQFLCSLNDDVRTFVASKQPETVDSAAKFADLFFSVSKIGTNSYGV